MKLIELLVRELPKRGGWPEGALNATQDKDGQVCFSAGAVPEFGYVAWEGGDWFGNEFYTITASDYATAIVTRDQYEAALARNDGWIEWGGGECPVERGTLVDIKDRDGYVSFGVEALNDIDAEDIFWRRGVVTDKDTEIIAYRPHRDINSRANDDRLEQDLNECIGQDVDTPEWNGEGLPPDGVECEVRYVFAASNWMPFRCVKSDAGVAFGWSGGDPVTAPIGKYEFRPLPGHREATRDAACDKICDAIRDAKRKTNIILTAESIYDAIAAGKIPGVKLEEK